MKLQAIMSSNVVTVGLDDRLRRVKDIFDDAVFHHLLVTEDGVLRGVVSDRDLLKSISPNIDTVRCTWRDDQTLDKPVHSVMSRKLITLRAQDSVTDAIAVFKQHKISCIPITDLDGCVQGIVTWRDIIKHFDVIIQTAMTEAHDDQTAVKD
jgi:acetoin utilization protein AcuB